MAGSHALSHHDIAELRLEVFETAYDIAGGGRFGHKAAPRTKEQADYNLKYLAAVATEDIGDVPVRLFLTQALLEEVEDNVYPQIVTATRFPGVKLVVITLDVHVGYGVRSVGWREEAVASGATGHEDYERLSSSTGIVRMPAVRRA